MRRIAEGMSRYTAHDAVEVRLVQDTFGSGKPPRCWRDGAALQQFEPEPGCGSSSAFAVPLIEERLMKAREKGLALGIAPQEVGCRRKPFEVLGFQRGLTVGGFEKPIRFAPGPSRE